MRLARALPVSESAVNRPPPPSQRNIPTPNGLRNAARNYRDDQRLPSQRKMPRDYRTRLDPFVDVWAKVQRKLEDEPALKARTLFEWLQEADPGRFPDSTRRTFEQRLFTVLIPQQTIIWSTVRSRLSRDRLQNCTVAS